MDMVAFNRRQDNRRKVNNCENPVVSFIAFYIALLWMLLSAFEQKNLMLINLIC